MDANRPHSADLSDAGGADLLGLARRHWWLALLLSVLGVGGALQFTSMQTKVFESATSVLVQPTAGGQDTNVVGGRTKGDINLDTEAQLVRSTAVATGAAQLLRSTTSPDVLAASVSVAVPANTSVLVITYEAGDARAAQAGSHAFAQSYLRNREDSAKADIAGQIATLTDKINQLNDALAQVNQKLAGLKGGDPNRANLETQRTTVVNQINTLAGRLNTLATTTVSAGQIIRDADLPPAPSRPNKLLNLASGAMIGLVLGVVGALIRERLDKRVRRAGDLPRRTDVPVIAAIPARMRPRLDDVFAPFGTGGRTFNRLRNEVLASMPPPLTGDTRAALAGQVVVVTGASQGAASTVVAANLAAAFARTGAETVLVSAHLPDSLVDLAPVDRMLGVRAVPGLSDMLAGRVPLRAAVQRAPRHPYLNVITTGGTASAAGLLQSQALRETLATLRERAAYVVVEAPSTATSADAQSLASLADAAIIAVELRRTRYSDVEDAADQLRRIGTPLLGAVALPRLTAGGGRGEHKGDDVPRDDAPVSDLWDDVPAVRAAAFDDRGRRDARGDNDVTAIIPAIVAAPHEPAPGMPVHLAQGMLPQGVLPQGVLPQGVLPQGVLPQGVLPQGAPPQGVVPQGAQQHGTRPGTPRDAVNAVNPITSATPLTPLGPPRRPKSRALDEHVVKRVGGGAELDALEQEVAGIEQRFSLPHPADSNGKSPEKRR